jgi:hypothetical protein
MKWALIIGAALIVLYVLFQSASSGVDSILAPIQAAEDDVIQFGQTISGVASTGLAGAGVVNGALSSIEAGIIPY